MTAGETLDGPANGGHPSRRRLMDPATALIAVAVLLPIALFALAAWQGYRDALQQAASRAARTTRVLEEHALKVFETHRLVIQQVNGRLAFIDWSRPEDRIEIHQLLMMLQHELQQVATISIVDADARLLASNRSEANAADISFADRDWFQALKASDPSLPFVSKAYPGRQSRMAIFNLAGRIRPRSGDAFVGAIAVSVDRNYFERFYETVEPTFDHSVSLIRDDGQILARVPASTRPALPDDSTMRARMRTTGKGLYVERSKMDGIVRIFAYRRVGTYPVFVRFGINKWAALAPWRVSLFAYGLVATLASLALLGVSMLALRQTDRERIARRRWEETAAALNREATERGRVEDQLRQSQKMEALGRLTGGVAHDFNNLLTAVIGSLDLLRRREGKIDPAAADLVDNALEGAHRAAALTSRLLTFSRQQPLKSVPVDANKVVAGMSELLRRTLQEKITIRTSLADGLWSTASDPNQLENAILNLAVNARDAMPGGGVLTIETANAAGVGMDGQRLDVAPGDYVTIAVSDTGTGMPPEILSKIFEPFYTTKPVGHGTGLGLSQVYGFAKQCLGHVAVQSEEGKGTRFEILFPRSKPDVVAMPAAPAVHRPSVPTRPGNGETILVVEDEPMVLRLSATILREAGYRVVVATDGRAALEQLRREPEVALLFTDVALGGAMTGRILADAALQERPGLPILFTSGYTGEALLQDDPLGEDGTLLAKPFTSEALLERVAELIAVHKRGEVPLPAL